MSAGRWYDSSPTSWLAGDGNSERGLTYDRNGNLRGVVRTGLSGAVVDEIELSYDDPANGNAVSGIVCDGVPGEPYFYDLDGNMVHDGRTGVWIEYNELNLPKKIRHDDVSEEISYIYSAAGEKLATEITLPGGGRSLTYYRGVMVYGASDDGTGNYVQYLQYMLQPEGLVGFDGDAYTYKYFKTDHLGSTRAVLAATNSSGFGAANQLVREQQTDYYPFGMAHATADNLTDHLATNPYLFSGKELQTTPFSSSLGSSILSLYDFGSRHYDPALGRWFNTDPALQFVSPYTYCGNNPHMYVDPNGRFGFLAWAGIAIAAGIGAHTGNKIAESKGYDFGDWQSWGYMLGGAAIGASSAYAGVIAATGGGFMANTMGIMVSSYTNSVGMSALSGGMINPSISFGAASYDLETGEWGYLFKKGNKWLQNLGYTFGAMANLTDAVSLFGGGTDYNINSASTNKKEGHEWWGHSSGTGDGIDISVGPAKNGWGEHKAFYDYMNPNSGGVRWDSYADYDGTWSIKLNNVNQKILQKMTHNIDSGKGLFGGTLKWNLFGYSCVNHVSRSLWAVGIPTLPINLHPHILNFQLFVRQLGIYSSPYLYQTLKTTK